MMKPKAVIFGFVVFGWMMLNLASSVFAVTGDVEKSFNSPGFCPTGLTFDGKYLYNCDRKTDMIYRIDPKNGKVVDSL